jgi:hypothetical protein
MHFLHALFFFPIQVCGFISAAIFVADAVVHFMM